MVIATDNMTCSGGVVINWCTSGFVDGVMFAHNGQEQGDTESDQWRHWFDIMAYTETDSPGGRTWLGVKFDVYSCFVFTG